MDSGNGSSLLKFEPVSQNKRFARLDYANVGSCNTVRIGRPLCLLVRSMEEEILFKLNLT